ncbi:MAG: zinc ABC transporter substrate-binding protein [Propylenella sp.]
MRRKLLGVSLTALLFAAGQADAETPHVVASIAPIHSLVASVMEGAGEPKLLIPAEVTEHDYALKPSDIRKIAGADLVVWLGESLEAYLVKPLETESVKQLELIDAEGIDPHAFREEEAHEENVAEVEEDEDEHGHFGLDPHVWLDPIRGVAIVRAVAEVLGQMDAENADLYAANAKRTAAALEALDREIRKRLTPLADRPFITFHDGYSYFVERYGLRQVGQLMVHPEQRPGAASLSALRGTVASENVACAFAEPQFDPGMLRSLAGDADMKVGVLDTLGAGLAPGPALYGALLRRNAEAVATCLTPTS